MDAEAIEYFRKREQIERQSATNATSAEARRAHEELAKSYADLIRRSGPIAGVASAAE